MGPTHLQRRVWYDLAEIFESFDIEPVASASIAQVHKATESGEIVAKEDTKTWD
jgi:predicted unusual protein kinase regulating ubiquinone biosynthesis (AarF/ABC1/UbiB family)